MTEADRGSAGIWVVALSGVLLLAGAASVLAGLAIVSRHEAGTAADLAALASASQAVSGSEVACAAAEEIAGVNGAELVSCALGADGVVDVTVTVTVQFGSLGLGVARADARAGPAGTDDPGAPTQPIAVGPQRSAPQPFNVDTAGAASASRTASRIVTAAPLSSGKLPLPHLADCTHEGQPDSHAQLAIVARVAVSQSRIA